MASLSQQTQAMSPLCLQPRAARMARQQRPAVQAAQLQSTRGSRLSGTSTRFRKRILLRRGLWLASSSSGDEPMEPHPYEEGPFPAEGRESEVEVEGAENGRDTPRSPEGSDSEDGKSATSRPSMADFQREIGEGGARMQEEATLTLINMYTVSFQFELYCILLFAVYL